MSRRPQFKATTILPQQTDVVPLSNEDIEALAEQKVKNDDDDDEDEDHHHAEKDEHRRRLGKGRRHGGRSRNDSFRRRSATYQPRFIESDDTDFNDHESPTHSQTERLRRWSAGDAAWASDSDDLSL